MKKNACKIIGFLLILCFVLVQLNDVFSFKYTDGITQMEEFYKQEEGTVDVLVLGSSHAFVDVNPAILYRNQGIAAYDLCASMQPMWHTYYYLKEALKYQSPKVIVMDVFRIVENFTYSKESKLVKSTYGMKFSKDKLLSIRESLSEEEQSEAYMYMLEFPAYHSRYVDLVKEDFTGVDLVTPNYKGYYPMFTTQEMIRPDVEHIEETYPIEEKTKKYFQMILELAKENEIPVLLVNAPYIMNEDDKKVYNSLEELLKTYDETWQVDYIDFNGMYDELGLDFQTDFADYDHLNHKGAEKFNNYLSDYLVNHYDLPDRRTDRSFETYEKNLEEWESMVQNNAEK